ncbi:VanZ family protein [Microbacterium sp. HD4P20]|uniref:VanZ family protein n=1 Tax=Microbacterium sp. HD4P20 TaxID=2864874 RepID=UPI001C63D686|nr:VanZ family protein [Microbacterium sp. HD4P20]MCP2636460.1 VanZ family protein [Microbacterium sp. HD4P20]
MTDNITTSRRRGIRLLAAALVAGVITILTLAPPSIAAPARGAFMRLVAEFAEPVVQGISWGNPDRVLNMILFVPLGATIALLLSRRVWPIAILAGFALSATVEYAQASIPGRVPDGADVLWNTVGGGIGVLLVTGPRLIAAAVARTRHRRTGTRAETRVSAGV